MVDAEPSDQGCRRFAAVISWTCHRYSQEPRHSVLRVAYEQGALCRRLACADSGSESLSEVSHRQQTFGVIGCKLP